MKKYYSHGQKREIAAFEAFRHLWKTDDENWVNARKEAFKLSSKYVNDGSPDVQFIANFYVYGEEPPTSVGEDTDNGFDIDFKFNKRLAYTPLTTPEEVKAFWQVVMDFYGRNAQQCHEYAAIFSGWLAGMPEQDEKVELITSTLFTPQYFMRYVGGEGADKDELSTIRPSDFIVGYSGLRTFYHKRNKYKKWDYRNFCFEYFMLCIRYCEENNVLQSKGQKKALPDMYEFLLSKDDAQLSGYRLKLKQQVMDAAMAEDAPALLKDALQKAKENLEE